MNFKRLITLLFALTTLPGLASCTSSKDQASQVVEAYYQALVTKNLEEISNLSCNSWEAQANNEFNSFAAVTAKLVDFTCRVKQSEVDQQIVSCQGKISADYGNEVLEIDLSKQTYLVVKEAGDWRFCGYQ